MTLQTLCQDDSMFTYSMYIEIYSYLGWQLSNSWNIMLKDFFAWKAEEKNDVIN